MLPPRNPARRDTAESEQPQHPQHPHQQQQQYQQYQQQQQPPVTLILPPGITTLEEEVAWLREAFGRAHIECQTALQRQKAIETGWKKDRERLDGEITSLHTQLTDAQKQHASLRTQLQIHESREPGMMVDGFKAINTAIRNFAHSITNSILDHYHPGDNVTTLNVASPELMIKLFEKAPLLLQNAEGKGRLIVDFLEVAIAYKLVSNLLRSFRNFHLEPLKGIDRAVNDVYLQIRKDESQLNAARWRSTTFNALTPFCTESSESWASHFISNILELLLAGIFGSLPSPESNPNSTTDPSNPLPHPPPPLYKLKPKEYDSLKSIFTLASTWNRDVKSTFFPLDFHVSGVPAGFLFDSQVMKLYDSKSPVPTVLPTVIAPVRLGLRSSVTYGKEKPEEWVWQEKVVVITEEFFS
jgi:hypothetical protein